MLFFFIYFITSEKKFNAKTFKFQKFNSISVRLYFCIIQSNDSKDGLQLTPVCSFRMLCVFNSYSFWLHFANRHERSVHAPADTGPTERCDSFAEINF